MMVEIGNRVVGKPCLFGLLGKRKERGSIAFWKTGRWGGRKTMLTGWMVPKERNVTNINMDSTSSN